MSEHRTGQLGDALEAASLAPFLQPVDDGDHPRGIAEAEIADLDRSRAGKQVLDHVLDLHDATAADDRDLHALRALVDHAQDDGLQGRPRDPAVALDYRGA